MFQGTRDELVTRFYLLLIILSILFLFNIKISYNITIAQALSIVSPLDDLLSKIKLIEENDMEL